MTNGTLKLLIQNTVHRGDVAGHVVLGAAVRAGFPPLAADRVRRTIALTANLASAELALTVDILPGELVVSMEGGGAGWSDSAARLLADHVPTIGPDSVRVVFRRAPLELV